ncbi:MAG: HAMP domain-containing histidine kinase [Bacteroidetes bacterium]|nr:HAMP domain-containing histidine kinase [Bacteroidota bacterium]
MIYNRFSLIIVVRSCLLLLSCILFAFVFFKSDRFFTLLFLGGIIIAQVLLLVYFLNTTNRDLARFLLNIQESDTSLSFNSKKIEYNFKGIHHSFKKINAEIQKIKIDRESKIHFLNNVVNHLGVAFMAYDNQGEILLLNSAAQQLFSVDRPKFISHIHIDNKEFHDFISQMPTNYQGVYNYKDDDNDITPLLVRSSEFILMGNQIRLVSFQSIKSQLDGNEMESWQKLMRVLAHEIANSLTPITMLGSNIRQRMINYMKLLSEGGKITENITNDVIRSAELIEQRGNRLIEFINNYKSYARLPKPSFSIVRVKDLFDQIDAFYQKQFKSEEIQFERYLDDQAQLYIDMSLMEQVLINLIQNSIDALRNIEHKKIELIYKCQQNNDLIQVIDNGIGISEEIIEHIFIPFFTTKNSGSGVGLSLSKNILHMHQGTISIQSKPNIKTIISLKIPKKSE